MSLFVPHLRFNQGEHACLHGSLVGVHGSVGISLLLVGLSIDPVDLEVLLVSCLLVLMLSLEPLLLQRRCVGLHDLSVRLF